MAGHIMSTPLTASSAHIHPPTLLHLNARSSALRVKTLSAFHSLLTRHIKCMLNTQPHLGSTCGGLFRFHCENQAFRHGCEGRKTGSKHNINVTVCSMKDSVKIYKSFTKEMIAVNMKPSPTLCIEKLMVLKS